MLISFCSQIVLCLAVICAISNAAVQETKSADASKDKRGVVSTGYATSPYGNSAAEYGLPSATGAYPSAGFTPISAAPSTAGVYPYSPITPLNTYIIPTGNLLHSNALDYSALSSSAYGSIRLLVVQFGLRKKDS